DTVVRIVQDVVERLARAEHRGLRLWCDREFTDQLSGREQFFHGDDAGVVGRMCGIRVHDAGPDACRLIGSPGPGQPRNLSMARVRLWPSTSKSLPAASGARAFRPTARVSPRI